MIKNCSSEKEIFFILEHLRHEDKEELVALYGDNWFLETLNDIKNSNALVLYGRDSIGRIVPIALGGFETLKTDSNTAVVWLIGSCFISLNRKLFWNVLRLLMKNANYRYKIMYNFIYKSNYKAKIWLTKLGFKFDNTKPSGINLPDGFDFFYKINKKGK